MRSLDLGLLTLNSNKEFLFVLLVSKSRVKIRFTLERNISLEKISNKFHFLQYFSSKLNAPPMINGFEGS